MYKRQKALRTFSIVAYTIDICKSTIGYIMYEFDLGAFLFGLIILTAGTVMVLFHQKIADIMSYGVSSYGKFRLWGLILIGVGLLIALNLHNFILRAIVGNLGIG